MPPAAAAAAAAASTVACLVSSDKAHPSSSMTAIECSTYSNQSSGRGKTNADTSDTRCESAAFASNMDMSKSARPWNDEDNVRFIPHNIKPEHGDDDDDSSVGSVTLLEQEDFDEQTWFRVVTPTNIVAMVAGGGIGLFCSMVASPLLVLPLMAATTYGASHLLAHAHELLIEEYVLYKTSREQTSDENSMNGHENGKELEEQATKTFTLESKTKDHSSCPTLQDASSRVGTPPPPPLVQSDEESVSINETSKSLVPISADEEKRDLLLLSSMNNQPPPPLEDTILLNQRFEGLNALEFFHVFFGDDAPFSFQEFQRKRGDVHIDYGRWKPLSSSSETSSTATTPQPIMKGVQRLQRDISFQTQTKSFFGPPFATCHKHQQVYVHKRLLVLECTVQLQGIPFCDSFSVKEQWVLNAPKSNSIAPEESHALKSATLSVHSQVSFTKPCPFASQIHAKSKATLTDVVSSWCQMAQHALELTLQKKLQEQRQQQEQKSRESAVVRHQSHLDSIEVTHSYSSSGKKSTIVLGDEDSHKSNEENEPPRGGPLDEDANGLSKPVAENRTSTLPSRGRIKTPHAPSLKRMKRSVLRRTRIAKKNGVHE